MTQRFRAIWHHFLFLALILLTACLIVACRGGLTGQNDSLPPLSNCRQTEHALGQICVPQDPEGVITLEETTFANAIALGVIPIGTATYDATSIDYLSSYSSQHQLLGHSGQPNIEEIFSLKPDLIVGEEFTGEAVFEQLSQIAPTALGQWKGYSSWREYFDFVARILGKEDKAEAVWADYEQQISKLKTTLDKQLQDSKVTAIYAYGDGMTIDAKNSFVGSIFADLGLRQPDYTATDGGTISLSEELIPTIDADFLFVSVYNAASEQILAKWEQKPLWNQLKAVKAGQVYVVNANVWRGGNPIAADLVIDELFTYLVKESA